MFSKVCKIHGSVNSVYELKIRYTPLISVDVRLSSLVSFACMDGTFSSLCLYVLLTDLRNRITIVDIRFTVKRKTNMIF